MSAALALAVLLAATAPGTAGGDDAWLGWDAKFARSQGLAMRATGRVGGYWDGRSVHTEHAYNYKLRATWLTPEVIRATARLDQLAEGLSDKATRELVAEAEKAGDTVLLVEIDPREGSGVVPLDWVAMLGPRTDDKNQAMGVNGTIVPGLRDVRALAGVAQRDYDYERFWVVFPLHDDEGHALLPADSAEAQLSVRIRDKQGHVTWPVPESIRRAAAKPGGGEVP